MSTYSLLELEKESGVSARTIRFYISQGLVPPPITVGRNAAYGDTHLLKLKQILQQKTEGQPLKNMVVSELKPLMSREWTCFQVADDVSVFITQNVAPWRRLQIEKALVALQAAIQNKDVK